MRAVILALVISWQGLHVGLENTALWDRPFRPGVSATATALMGVGRVTARVVWIQPLQKDGYGPAVQFGASVRLF